MTEVLAQVRPAWRVYETEVGPVRIQRLQPKGGSKIQDAIRIGLRKGYQYCHPTVGQCLQGDRSTVPGFLVMPTSAVTIHIFLVLPGGSRIAPVERSLSFVEQSPLGWLLVMADPA